MQIYVNTNKTADRSLAFEKKGFPVPWPLESDYRANPYFWIEKLRNWQEKYNPLGARVSWANLPANLLKDVKSDYQLERYSDACFLLREPAAEVREFPIADSLVAYAWTKILRQYEIRLADQRKTHRDGSAIRLTDGTLVLRALFPLHSLRVSIITSLVEDGKLPLDVLQKVVGHSRLVMSIYYIKHGRLYINEELQVALRRMDKTKTEALSRALKSEGMHALFRSVVTSDPVALAAAVPEARGAPKPGGLDAGHDRPLPRWRERDSYRCFGPEGNDRWLL